MPWCYMKSEEIESCNGLFGGNPCMYARKYCAITPDKKATPLPARSEGYYWVKMVNDNTKWVIAEWYRGSWFIMGHGDEYRDEDFLELGPVVPPKGTP